ncbi:MAG: hypothetical protein AB1Z98_29665 [Nannocystaceae bacterium]
MPDRSTRDSSPAWLAALAAVIAIAWLVVGLGDYGLWSEAELPALDRVRAALGAALSELEHHPWLPELLRTRSYALLSTEAGLRLPHALAGAMLVAMATGLARARGASLGLSLLAGAFALAFPALAAGSRTVLGNPVGEMMLSTAVLSGLAALHGRSVATRGVWALASLGALALSVASCGLAIGGALPLGVVAAAATLDAQRLGSHRIAAALWLAFAIALGVTVRLSLEQGDGYIPLLGAAKDLVLVDKPEQRRFAASLEDLGYSLYPWAPLVVVGALLGRRDRVSALWLGLAVTIVGGFGLVYGGPQPLPVTVPAALCAVAAVEWVLDPTTERHARRAALAVTILAMLVIRKDAERTPARVTVPLQEIEGEHTFPAERLEASTRLKSIGGLALLALLAAGLLAPAGGPSTRADRWLDRLPRGPRAQAPIGLLAIAALLGAHRYAHELVPQTCDLLSPRTLMEHHAALVEAELVSPQLGNHRVRDAGLARYGPGDVVSIGSRREMAAYLDSEEPRAAIIRDRDLPALHQDHRVNGWPLFVLDDRHFHLRLISNRLPPGEQDLSPIPSVLFDEPVVLANPTRLRFEGYIEIVGWELTDPIVRGRPVKLQLAIEVLRPLPGGSKIYARLLKGRSSRLNSEPMEPTGGVYPANLWREGDYVLHELEFEAPLLEIQPGTHELIVGLRRGEKQNFEISVPEGKEGEHGVLVRDKKRSFARIGSVEVW